MGRFINADTFVSTGQGVLGNNMFAYCNNNPVAYADPGGNLPKGIINQNAMTRGGGGGSRYTDPNDPYRQTVGFIYGQGAFPYADASLGWGNYSRNGCGVIAIYNALQLLGNLNRSVQLRT